jgi:protein-tyrosine phosphatase
LGNICRSPTGEGVLLHLAKARGVASRLMVDSAGTAAYHVGERPDPRALAAARRRGFDLPSRARQFQRRDFERFDYVMAMDEQNHDELRVLSSGHFDVGIRLLRDFDPLSARGSSVPDPYYGGVEGFETVLDQCVAACTGLLDTLERQGEL